MTGGIGEMANTEHKRRLRKYIGVPYDSEAGAFISTLYEESTNADELRFIKKNLRMCIEEDLSPRQKEVLVMHYYQGLSVTSIVDHIGVNKSTVSRTLKRAVEKLRKCLKYGAARLLETGGE